jgi:NAD(P)-dependent dehydrogenase (short-subunit alcohol dehydrogenase family)
MNPKLVIITGASAGIGRETAIYLADAGYTVFACARSENSDLADYQNISYLRCDITSEEDVLSLGRAVGDFIKDRGPLASLGLVNNAALSLISPLEISSRKEFDDTFLTNAYAPLRLVQTLLPFMKTVPSRIINVSSGAGVLATPLYGVYSMSKFAVEAMSDVMRVEFKQFGIHTIVVQPGLTKSTMHDKGLECIEQMDPEVRRTYERQIRRTVLDQAEAAKTATEAVEVSKVIKRALEAKRPAARYAAGSDSKLLRRIHWLLNDRLRDLLHAKRGGW